MTQQATLEYIPQTVNLHEALHTSFEESRTAKLKRGTFHGDLDLLV